MKKPWQTLSRLIDYKNPYWQVRKDKVIKPDGSKGFYHVVDVRDVVSVVALEGKSVYLVRQWRYPINRNSWETSRGIMNRGETPVNAAKRELREETGLTAKKWKKIGFSYLANGLTNQAFHVFLAQQLMPGKAKLDPGEHDLITKKFLIKKVDEMIRSGILTDSPTIVSFYYLKKFL